MNLRRAKQAGYLLIEAALALALSGILLYYQLGQQQRALAEQMGATQGDQMKTLADGLNAYTVTNYSTILNNTSVTGIALTRQPTVAELAALGFLPTAFSANNFFGGGYTTSLSLNPPACVLPNCNIMGYVAMTTPILVSGVYNPNVVGAALAKMGADGGASNVTAPATISGFNAGWSIPNPVGGTPAGILAMRVGSGAAQFAQFLRRDGSLAMLGNLDMGNFSISNAGTISLGAVVSSGAACTTNGTLARDATGNVMACVSGSYQQAGGGQWKNPVANFAALPAVGNMAGDVRLTTDFGRAYSWTGAAWSALAVDQSGNLTIPNNLSVTGSSTLNTLAGNLQITTTATSGVACSPNGRLAQDGTGLLLTCHSSVWQKAQGGGKTLSSNLPADYCPSTTTTWTGRVFGITTTSGYKIDAACNLSVYNYTNSTSSFIGNIASGFVSVTSSFGGCGPCGTELTMYTISPTGLTIATYTLNTDVYGASATGGDGFYSWAS
ncbi:MAG: hypothetical protein WAO76_14435 [Georgfuchsia sp.]